MRRYQHNLIAAPGKRLAFLVENAGILDPVTGSHVDHLVRHARSGASHKPLETAPSSG